MSGRDPGDIGRRPGALGSGRGVPRLLITTGLAACLAVVANCAGDFDRPRPVLFGEGSVTRLPNTVLMPTASKFAFTDDEQRMRELAYPLLLPPNVGRWWSVVPVDLSFAAVMSGYGPAYDPAVYAAGLVAWTTRSEAARYARLIDDIHDDMARIGPFNETARRVLEMDRRRERSLGAATGVTVSEGDNALARVGENARLVERVGLNLQARAVCYRAALERLSIEAPSPRAADAERVLITLQRRIAALALAAPAVGPAIRTLD